jgi:hypothetical protein
MSVSRVPVYTEASRSLDDDRAEFVEPLGCRNRGARGAVTGVLLGAGLWGAILALAGVIKL